MTTSAKVKWLELTKTLDSGQRVRKARVRNKISHLLESVCMRQIRGWIFSGQISNKPQELLEVQDWVSEREREQLNE